MSPIRANECNTHTHTVQAWACFDGFQLYLQIGSEACLGSFIKLMRELRLSPTEGDN
jgi:hypothetical protein